jgi:uncharacterized protein YceK
MKRLLLAFATGLLLAGCGPINYTIKSQPLTATDQDVKLDDLQCTNASQWSGPFFFGIGHLIYRHLSKESYETCMRNKGYVVEEV